MVYCFYSGRVLDERFVCGLLYMVDDGTMARVSLAWWHTFSDVSLV